MAAEVGLAAFSSIVSEGAKTLFEPIMRQISYVFNYQSYIDGLKDQVKQLGYKREMVQQPVNHARLQGDELYEGVTDWLHSVDEFISEGVAKSIIDDEDRAKKSCFKGLYPNLICRYKLSKQAAKAAEAAASLVGKGKFIMSNKVSYRPAPKRAELGDVKDHEAFDSRKKIFQEVMEAVKDDKLSIIGVNGVKEAHISNLDNGAKDSGSCSQLIQVAEKDYQLTSYGYEVTRARISSLVS